MHRRHHFLLLVVVVFFAISTSFGQGFVKVGDTISDKGLDVRWRNILIVFPHNGSDLTYDRFPADVLIEVSLQGPLYSSNKTYLPVATTDYDEIGMVFLSIVLDELDVGSIHLGPEALSLRGAVARDESTGSCGYFDASAPSHQPADETLIQRSIKLKKLEQRHAKYFQDFLKQEFGSEKSSLLAEQWMSTADELAALSKGSSHSGSLPHNSNKAGSSASFIHMEANKQVNVSLVGVRRGVLWTDAQLPRAREMLWLSLELHGVMPGQHRIRLVDRLNEDDSNAADVFFKVLGTEEVERMHDGSAPLIGISDSEAAQIPHSYHLLPKDSDWGQEYDFRSNHAARALPEKPGIPAQFSTISICVLTGFPPGARESLSNSLKTWVESGLLSAVNETIIFIQTILPTDFELIPTLLDALAHENHLARDSLRARVVGSTGNIGIGRALGRLLDLARTEHVLFLEDDWIMPFSRTIWVPVLTAALSLLHRGRADVVRLKSDEESPQLEGPVVPEDVAGLHYVLNCGRFPPPHAPHFFCACLDRQMQAMAAEGWAGRRAHEAFHDVEVCWQRPPDGVEVGQGEGSGAGGGGGGGDSDGGGGGSGGGGGEGEAWAGEELVFYCVPSRICKYTNTPSLFSRDWFRQRVGPVANADPGIGFSKHYLEETVNTSWPHRPFVVAVPSSGLFAHMELADKTVS